MKILLLTPILALGAITLLPAQQPPNGGGPHGGPNGEHRPPMPPPPSPLIHILDTDDDGILSAAEIKNAPQALLTLDKNKDGQLSPKELCPPPPKPPQGEKPDDDQKSDGTKADE
jgi:hypothetical protein